MLDQAIAASDKLPIAWHSLDIDQAASLAESDRARFGNAQVKAPREFWSQ